MRDVFKDYVADGARQDVVIDCVDAAGTQHLLNATFGYDPTDPYAVTLTFLLPEGDVVWTFGRDLLHTGMSEPAGDGDVHVWPETDDDDRTTTSLMIELCSPDGHLLANVDAAGVRAFLARSEECIPLGDEARHLDVDSLLTRLLAS
jgi:hypothetical protein